jgi:hypothetical protein
MAMLSVADTRNMSGSERCHSGCRAVAINEDSTMTKTLFTSGHSRARTTQVSRLLAATCAVAFLIGAGLAHAQSPAALDTSTLPRPAAIKQLVALPQTTIILSADPVPVATKAALALLEKAGWQRYLRPGSNIPVTPTSETHQLKKGAQALTLFVQTAPAHNNATAINYTPSPLSRDLPFPAEATNIVFSESPLHLDATVLQAHEALLAFYRTALGKAGWTLHSASDGSAAMKLTTEAAMHHAFFTHGTYGALHVTARQRQDGQSTIAIRAVPASVLPGAQVARQPEPQAPQPNPHLDAHKAMSQKMDGIAADMMKQALRPSPPPSGGVEGALAAARAAGVRIDMPGKNQPAGSAPAPEAAKEPALERDEVSGLPVPKGASSKGHEKTPWRLEVNATVKASPASILAFYQSELAAKGWREDGPVRNEGKRMIQPYTSAEGPAVLTLERKGSDTAISLLLRKEAEARKAGMLPKAGQAKLVFASMMEAEATVVTGGRTIKIAAGVGSKAPDGPSLEVAPGAHKVTIKSPGKPDVTETVTVRADDIWGVLLGPGGALSVPMY